MPTASAARITRARSTRTCRAPGRTVAGRAVEGDPRRAAGGVEVERGLDGDAGGVDLDDHDVVAGRRGRAAGRARRRARRRSPRPCRRETVTEPARATPAVDGAVGEAGQELRLAWRRRRGGDDRAGDRRGDEGTGGDGPAELLDHDDELLEAVARAAVLLGEVEARPPEPDQVVPERRQLLGRRLEQRPGRAAGVALLQELRRRLGQRLVVFGDRDRHGRHRT